MVAGLCQGGAGTLPSHASRTRSSQQPGGNRKSISGYLFCFFLRFPYVHWDLEERLTRSINSSVLFSPLSLSIEPPVGFSNNGGQFGCMTTLKCARRDG
ncbi:hypothetical protein GALMADRAFT_449624 [Galerina marginata CBS 339.88]|uniref:Uncharacterized protein n=1 Tax=Galerina marginata (strain CBS 339.88) TaxID=685588 RepID=A0A067T9G3_GALM3|nr:hypothetical protein GALMADRAFT_449624 [Galerina marginata CBS 339.88]